MLWQKTVCVLLLPLQKPRKISDNETIIVSIDKNVNQMRKRGKTAFSRQKRQTGQTRQEATSSGDQWFISSSWNILPDQICASNSGRSGVWFLVSSMLFILILDDIANIVSGGSFDLSTATATDYWGRTGNCPRWHFPSFDDFVMSITFMMMINNYMAVTINQHAFDLSRIPTEQ